MPEPAKSAPITNAQQFRLIKDKQDDLVLACTNMAVIAAPYGVDLGEIVDDSTGNLLPMPPEAFSLGEIQKQAGVDLTPDMKTEGVMGYGSRAQRRIFVTEENFDIDLVLQEIRKIGLQMWLGFEDEDVENTDKVTRIKKRAASRVKYWTIALIGLDEANDMFPFWKFPKVSLNKKGKMSLAEAKEMGLPMTMSVFEEKGEMFEMGLAGPGWPKLARKAGFFTDDSEEEEEGATKTVTLPRNVSGGTFTLTLGGETTEPIEHNATGTAVAAALNKLSSVSGIKGTGSAGGPYKLTGVKGLLTGTGTSLSGGQSTDITVK
ncbi:phage tail protein [Corynebacterium diphtheriae]|nr:phage tail protein [Corynebacterium diphtheriae]